LSINSSEFTGRLENVGGGIRELIGKFGMRKRNNNYIILLVEKLK